MNETEKGRRDAAVIRLVFVFAPVLFGGMKAIADHSPAFLIGGIVFCAVLWWPLDAWASIRRLTD